jgi:large subunit ribosomal protein L31
MKKGIHPQVFEVTARCVCGNSFATTSTESSMDIDICSQCHPFFTGAQKFIDTAGRIERFQRRYEKDSSKRK